MKPLNIKEFNNLLSQGEGGRTNSRYLSRNYGYNHEMMIAVTTQLIEAGIIEAPWHDDQYFFKSGDDAALVMANCYKNQQHSLHGLLGRAIEEDNNKLINLFGFSAIADSSGHIYLSQTVRCKEPDMSNNASNGSVH